MERMVIYYEKETGCMYIMRDALTVAFTCGIGSVFAAESPENTR